MNLLFPVPSPARPSEQTQGRLMTLAAAFVFLLCASLSLAPAARLRSWDTPLRWDHWLGFFVWLVLFSVAHRQISERLPEHDPYLLPIAALLSGWGIVTIWRLSPPFGVRQTAWLAVSILVLLAALRLPSIPELLRRYKYLWLSAGLALLGMTFMFGTFPEGSIGPRLWLGCCGVYFQPSEILKLLLVVYLAAYLAGQSNLRGSLVSLAAPSLVMAGLVLVLLVAQRDLGTASLFIFIFTVVLFLASERALVLTISALVMALASLTGYFLFDVVKLRVDAWLNPWLDPSGRSYQIVQSLIAVANGGIVGRGIGLGSPSLVPVSHSDFIFAAIAEETGLVGSLALLGVLALFTARGLTIALHAPDSYRRYLAAGLTAALVSQSILIIGGNLRLLPLTGVTLPFVSYGGSSLLTAFLALLLLLHISSHPDEEPAWLPNPRPFRVLGLFFWASLLAAGLLAGWWAVYRAPGLLERQDNPRRSISDRYVPRGALLYRDGEEIQATQGEPGNYERVYHYAALAPVSGYSDAIFGQAGLEATLDPILRGLDGYPAFTLWMKQLLYGTPPPGLDVRLTLDLDLQIQADTLLGDRAGALVMINAHTGEVLAMASHPGFDPATLEENWPSWSVDPSSPFLNRAALGQYDPGSILGPFLLAGAETNTTVLAMDDQPKTGCPLPVTQPVTWSAAVAAGCPEASQALAQRFPEQELDLLLASLKLDRPTSLSPLDSGLNAGPIPSSSPTPGTGQLLSPLQVVLAGSALTNNGQTPAAARLVSAVNRPGLGWRNLPGSGDIVQAIDAGQANRTAQELASPDFPGWSAAGISSGDTPAAWFLAGSLPDSPATPLVVVVVLESGDVRSAKQIAISLMRVSQP